MVLASSPYQLVSVHAMSRNGTDASFASTTTHPLFLASLLLALNCLVRGEGRDDIFVIKIARSEAVSALRQHIKGARGLKPDTHPPKLWKVLGLDEVRDIDADRRWQVDFPINNEVISMLRKSGPLDPDKGFHELSPVDRLSKVFPTDPIEGHLHIIVQTREFPQLRALVVAPATHFVSFPRPKLFGSRRRPQ